MTLTSKFKILGFHAIFLSLIKVCLSADTICNSKDNSTANYNPFLNFLGGNAVLGSLYTSNNFDVCNDIWSEGNVGTCCNKERVNSTFTKILNHSITVWDNYITSLVYLRNEIRKEMQTEFISSYDAQQAFQSMQGDSKYNLNGLTAGQAVYILDSINTFEADMKIFRTDGKKCFDFLMKKRGQIFCWGCRFGGEAYFKIGGPIAKITPNSAQLLVESCHSTWKFLSRTMLLRFTWNNLKQYSSETDQNYNVTILDVFFQGSSGENYGTVFNAFENCPNPTSYQTAGSNCKDADLQILTKAFFNFGLSEKLMNFAPVVVVKVPPSTPSENSSNSSNTTDTSNSTNSTNTTNTSGTPAGRLLQGSGNTTTPPAALPENNPSIVFDITGIDLTKFPSMATPYINTSKLEFWTAGGIKDARVWELSWKSLILVTSVYLLS